MAKYDLSTPAELIYSASSTHSGGVKSLVTIRERPVTSFLLITFVVSYALGVPFNIAASSILESSTLAGIYVPRVVTVIGPAVAAIAVALAGGGGPAAARLFRSLRLRADDVWWVAPAAVVSAFAWLAGFYCAVAVGLAATDRHIWQERGVTPSRP